MPDERFAPRPYAPELLTAMARVEAHYLLRVLREEGGGFAERAITHTPWHGMLPATCDWATFIARTEAVLLPADAAPEPDRVARFLDYASPLFAQSALASEADFAGYRWFDNFRYHPHPELRAISLHIRNNCMPASPFDDLPACVRSLRRLGEAAAATEPYEIAEVLCGSWLNDLPIFRALFPPAYRASLEVSPPDTKSGFGWWGQLIDKTGRLHARRAAMIVETGQFPHPRQAGHCAYDAFMRHVAAGCPENT